MYNYTEERHKLFTDEGQKMFLKVRDQVNRLISSAGAVRAQEAFRNITGDDWLMSACLDRMVELGEIVEVKPDWYTPGQHRIFTKL